jgi:nitrate/TMAO reductase-like tetraheme cytochrome c subunit
MPSSEYHGNWWARLVHLSNNWLTFLGVILTTTGGVSWLFILPLSMTGEAANPYLGILFFAVFPALFFAGLALMPLGIWLKIRKERKAGTSGVEFPAVSWGNVEFRRIVSVIVLATLVNLIIGGHYTYAAVEYMDSVSFCGLTCHTVMKPEFTAYQESPHFHVSCTECHIGEGASWFVRSKLSGVRQVFATALNTYSRPIEQPVHNLRPARETCEQCHWPQRFNPYRLRVIDKYAEDETNTHTQTVLMMKIAGGEMQGIHGFHLTPGVVIEYRSDRSRQTIPWVRYTSPAGEATEYAAADWDPAKADQYELRTMDCVDCHNRPTHEFDLADRAMDRAMAAGRIDPSLPGVKSKGLEIIQVEYGSTGAAQEQIPKALREFYRTEHPDTYQAKQEAVEESARALLAAWERNVFPEMRITWGTYTNHVGHTDYPGCYRCHDDAHAAANGKTITQECSSCHEMLAWDESNPEILTKLGITRSGG